jgi:hypothetical protein
MTQTQLVQFRVALQYNIQGVAVFSQVHLCILCNYNKYYETIRQVVVSTYIYIYIYIYRHPTLVTPTIQHE